MERLRLSKYVRMAVISGAVWLAGLSVGCRSADTGSGDTPEVVTDGYDGPPDTRVDTVSMDAGGGPPPEADASATDTGQRDTGLDAGARRDAEVGSADTGAGPVSLDAELQTFVDQHEQVPGVVATVFGRDRIFAEGAAGTRNVNETRDVRVGDPLHLGSCGKAMTATLVGRLVEQGTLSWDQTIPELLPSLSGELDEAYRPVTLAQLIRHEAGLPTTLSANRSEVWQYMVSRGDMNLEKTRREAARRLLSEPPASDIDSFQYANASYLVVGAILEAATGKSWEELMRNEMFSPLGMTGCGFGPPASPGSVDAPWGHRDGPNGLNPVDPGARGADNPPALGPAGTAHCPLRQWAKFGRVHVGEGPQGYVTSGTLDELHRPGDSERPYAGGWLVYQRDWADGDALYHGGSNTMFHAVAWLAPSRNTGIMVATNGPPDREAVNQLVEDLVGRFVED